MNRTTIALAAYELLLAALFALAGIRGVMGISDAGVGLAGMLFLARLTMRWDFGQPEISSLPKGQPE